MTRVRSMGGQAAAVAVASDATSAMSAPLAGEASRNQSRRSCSARPPLRPVGGRADDKEMVHTVDMALFGHRRTP